MEQIINVPVTEQDIPPRKPSLTLEEAAEKMRALLLQSEENAWEIGDLLNTVEREGLARREYGKARTWLEAKVPEARGKTSSLYRYANVAAVYTREQMRRWGNCKLQLLLAHDQDVLGHSSSEDPADREVQIVQPDGSTVNKKFHECSYRDLQLSNQLRRKSHGRSPQKQAAQQGEVRSLSKSSPTASAPATSHTERHSLRVAFALMALGIVLSLSAQLLPDFLGLWIFIAAAGCMLSGIGIVIRRWDDFREGFITAVKEGKAFEFLGEHLDKARHGVENVAKAIRSKVKSARTPTSSSEETPPTEKKAA